jgi:hypothetical protein
MKFFKHFTDAHRGQSLRLVQKRFGVAGIGRYWIFIELCAEKLEKNKEEEFTEHHCTFEFETSYLARSLGYANLKQCSSYLQALAELGLCSVVDNGEITSCSVPKLLESMDRDSKRARKERVPSAPKKKIKIKEEDKDKEEDKELDSSCTVLAKAKPVPDELSRSALVLITNEDQFSGIIPQATQSRWMALYNDSEFLKRETMKAFNWYENNPKKKPKTARGWVQALSSWFERGWPKYQKQIESVKNVGYSEREMRDILSGGKDGL